MDTQARLSSVAGAQDQVNVVLYTYEGRLAQAEAQQEATQISMGRVTSQLSLLGSEFTAALGPIGSMVIALGPSMLQGAMQGSIVKLMGKGGFIAGISGLSS